MAVEGSAQDPVRLLVPNRSQYHNAHGIGRVFTSLVEAWGTRTEVKECFYKSLPLPFVRNIPYGIGCKDEGDILFLPQLTGASALRSSRVPSVVVVHDIGVVDCPADRGETDFLTHRAVLASFKGMRHASRIVADSQFTRTRLIALVPELAAKVSVIGCGVSQKFLGVPMDRAAARARIEQSLGRQLPAKLILYVGTERPRKNMGLLLNAVAAVLAVDAGVGFIKAGSAGGDAFRGHTQQYLKRLGLHTDERVVFFDGVDDELLVDLYTVADVFVSASLYEGFGLPILEAMACGTACVVTRAGALEEIVRGSDGGFVVDYDERGLTEAIRTVLSQPLSEAHRQRLRRQAAAHTWDHAAEQYLDVLRFLGTRPDSRRTDFHEALR